MAEFRGVPLETPKIKDLIPVLGMITYANRYRYTGPYYPKPLEGGDWINVGINISIILYNMAIGSAIGFAARECLEKMVN